MRTKILAVMLVLLFSGCTRGPLGRMMRSGEVQEYYAANPSTPAEVRLAIGTPQRSYTTHVGGVTVDHLVYGKYKNVYLSNDVVTAIQE